MAPTVGVVRSWSTTMPFGFNRLASTSYTWTGKWTYPPDSPRSCCLPSARWRRTENYCSRLCKMASVVAWPISTPRTGGKSMIAPPGSGSPVPCKWNLSHPTGTAPQSQLRLALASVALRRISLLLLRRREHLADRRPPVPPCSEGERCVEHVSGFRSRASWPLPPPLVLAPMAPHRGPPRHRRLQQLEPTLLSPLSPRLLPRPLELARLPRPGLRPLPPPWSLASPCV